jgi:hypothetical protein
VYSRGQLQRAGGCVVSLERTHDDLSGGAVGLAQVFGDDWCRIKRMRLPPLSNGLWRRR